MKTGYYLNLFTPETIKLLGINEKKDTVFPLISTPQQLFSFEGLRCGP